MCYGNYRLLTLNPSGSGNDLRYHPGTDGAAALTDGKTQAFLHGDGVDQFCRELDVVAGHHHFHTVGQLALASNVGGTEVKLWAITCLLYTSPSPRDLSTSRMPSSA